jgi:hypothetical protein
LTTGLREKYKQSADAFRVEVIMYHTVFRIDRVVLVLTALALFVIAAKNVHAEQVPVRTADPNISSSASNMESGDANRAMPPQLTRKEVKKLIATAKSPEDHLKLAGYYKARVEKLDAEAAGYEQAAAGYRTGPVVKNLMAPNTAARKNGNRQVQTCAEPQGSHPLRVGICGSTLEM